MRYLLIIAVFLHTQLIGAQIDLTYYLPDIKYEETITTPQDFFGHQIGEWHLSHDKLSLYVQQLAKESPRVKYIEYARSHEYRPLAYLLISSVKNQARISEIQTEHLALSNPSTSASLNISKMPAVIYQGYNVHGNESSGGNAAALIAYYLAAAKGREVERLLDNTVILLDPCMNPDGFHRFSTWVNMHKNKHLTADPQDREYAEAWPGGRTNHYWFDLNRDWLPVQHPESRGRIRVFHEWKPNILTDHHEMSSNFTFFFQPGVPQRTNPITPDTNQVLTEKIGNYHAAALDEIGSLYFSKERYDDFYYGKGSTYPDANACIGILFEQGSSRGHLQETDNGILSFPFTIRNQVVTSFSTQQAALDLREELLNYQRDFHQTALSEAKRSPIKGYVFSEKNDKTRLNGLLHILLQHQIDVYKATNALSANGERFPKENTYIVPMQQTQHRLVRAMFETNTTFQDSLFYDVSTWTLPLAFNLDYAPLKGNVSLGKKITAEDLTNEGTTPDFSRYAYLMEWEEYFAPTALYQIMKRGLRAKVASSEFQLNQRKFKAGTILIPVQNQPMQAEEIYALLEKLAQTKGVNIYDMDTGLTAYGIDLGSSDFELLEKPSVLLLVGEGVTSYDAGEVWHQLDQRYEIPVSMLETTKLARADLSRYNVIILPSGSYQAVSGMGIQKLREWSMKGGTIIGIKNAVRWLSNKSLARIDFQAQERKSVGRRPYDKIQEDRGSYLIGGAIFEAMIDQTHPLFYGYSQRTLPTFRKGTLFFKPTENQYAMPSIYSPS
ncbi:MAG: M14 family zinc carboxypeptidase, partial [Bacteroidota bacterium]